MYRILLIAFGVSACVVAGCRGPQACTDPVIVSSSPIGGCMPATSGCSSCAGGGAGAAGAVVSPFGAPQTVGSGQFFGPN
jgi:hypothetical protein